MKRRTHLRGGLGNAGLSYVAWLTRDSDYEPPFNAFLRARKPKPPTPQPAPDAKNHY